MEIEAYLKAYQKFCDEFKIPTSPEARAAKLLIEVDEYSQSLVSGTHEEQVSEALDVMNCAIANVVALGMAQPLFFGWQKLEATAEKYRMAKVGVTLYGRGSPRFEEVASTLKHISEVHKEPHPRTYIDAPPCNSRQVAGSQTRK